MAPSCSNALLFDVHYDGIFMFAPLRYENGVVYELRVTKDKKYDYEGLCQFLKEKLEQRFYAMFFKLPKCELDVRLKIVECDSDLEAMYEFADSYGIIQMYLAHIPQNLAEYYFKNFCFDESGDEAICKLRIHENRKKDAGNMSYEELVSWAEAEAQHLNTPPKPKTVSKKVWDSLTPKKNDTGACGSGTNVEFEFDYADTGASLESVDDQTGAPSAADHTSPSEAVDEMSKDKIIEEDNIVNKVVDKGKGKMIEEERPVPARKAMGRNKGIVIEENDNPNVMDSDSSDSEVEVDEIPDYSMLYSDSESEYSDRSVDYLSEGEDELIQLRKRNSEAKRAPKVSKQKPCSDKEGGEGSSRPKTLYGLGETETVLEHEEFMDDLVRKIRECDDDAELTDPFKLVETRVEKYPTHDQDTHWKMKKPKVREKFTDAAQFKECLTDMCTDIAKISRKRSKPDKHGYGNGIECAKAGRMLSKVNSGQLKPRLKGACAELRA
ncbi:hypothetical protein Tco_0290599 [Tanacetum coccineum]